MPLLAAPSTPPTNTWASARLDAALENEINDAVRATIAKVMKDATDASSDDSSDVADTLEQLRGLIYGLWWFHDPRRASEHIAQWARVAVGEADASGASAPIVQIPAPPPTSRVQFEKQLEAELRRLLTSGLDGVKRMAHAWLFWNGEDYHVPCFWNGELHVHI